MKRQLKVAHVVASLQIGGLEKVVADEIHRFNRENIHSIVYCVNKKGEYAERLEEKNIDVSLVKKKQYPLSLAFALAGMFKREKIDIVHSHSGVYRDATLAGMLAKVPIIVHTDHGRFYPDARWTRFNHRFFSHFRDKIIAVSDELKNFLIEEMKINPNKIVQISNGVDVSEHDIKVDIEKKKKELGIPRDNKIVGIIARFAPVKNHATLFLAFKKVREFFEDVTLLVVGDGRLRDVLKDLVVELGVEKNVIFLGNRKDVIELLHVMNIVCLSSLSEGLSMTLIEAMASGKPVVATKVGGNPELIVDGVTGLLVPPRNPDRIAEAIVKLLRDEELRKTMGEEAKKRIEKEFNINNIVKQYEELYFELAREKGIL